MKKVITLSRSEHTEMTEEEFTEALSDPVEKAGRLLEKYPDLHEHLNMDEKSCGKGKFRKTWGKVFPDAAMPKSQPLAVIAICLEFFRQRETGLNRLHKKHCKSIIYFLRSDSEWIISRRYGTDEKWHGESAFVFNNEAHVLRQELSAHEIPVETIVLVLWRFKKALLDDPRLFLDNPVQEPAKLIVEKSEIQMSDKLADRMFSLLKLNASEDKG